MTSQPNIVFIQVDQLAASFLPAYGNTLAKTPHIDALTARALVFESAYTNFALCAPSRFSMLSGRLASEVGAYDNGAEFPSSYPTYAHYLKAAGYHTALVGKMHFVGADQLHGFDERLTIDIYPASFQWTGDWTDTSEDHGNDSRSFTLAGPVTRNVQIDYDEEVLHRARRKLFDLGRGVGIDDGQPWHLTLSFTHPHDPYQCDHEHWARYDHDEIDMPTVGRLAEQDPYSFRLLQQTGLEHFEPTDEQIRTARHGYYGSVSYVDDIVGSVVTTIREAGVEDNTVIVFSTDHGDFLGERGLWYKRSFFEPSSRIPLMIAGPGIDAGRTARNVSLADVLPTFVELAGGTEVVGPIEGTSLLTSDRDVVFGENLSEGATAPLLMAKRGDLKYVWSGCDPEQLFDLANDPRELTNLAGDAAYTDAQTDLSSLVHDRWDVQTLGPLVEESQRRRTFLRELYAGGRAPEWRQSPTDQATRHVLPEGIAYNDWVYDNIID
ncbi:MAG: choline-sulfatase [Actinomycetota bacterium]